jgi:hypothetical protein
MQHFLQQKHASMWLLSNIIRSHRAPIYATVCATNGFCYCNEKWCRKWGMKKALFINIQIDTRFFLLHVNIQGVKLRKYIYSLDANKIMRW